MALNFHIGVFVCTEKWTSVEEKKILLNKKEEKFFNLYFSIKNNKKEKRNVMIQEKVHTYLY